VTVERVATADDPRDLDPRLADFTALNDPAARRELERRGEHFVAEGLLVLEQLVASRYRLRTVLVADDAFERVSEVLGDRASDVPVLVAPREQLRAITGFAFHRGVLASAWRAPLPPARDVIDGASVLVVAEGLNDHENLGALFRNAAALGAGGVLVDPTTADPLYRRSIRVSLGHVLRVPWTRVDPWPAGLESLRAAGFRLVALTPSPSAESITSVVRSLALGATPRVALLVGAEGSGLSAGALAAADRRARIEMAPGVDSLNVATAAAIALHLIGVGDGGGVMDRQPGRNNGSAS
jgi:tRNA G18 (ribose-2'-O)-methylase SpoU